MGAVCVYVLLGLSLAFVSEAVGELGARPFFVSQQEGTRGGYVYFSFLTMATVGPRRPRAPERVRQGACGDGGLVGQIYLV